MKSTTNLQLSILVLSSVAVTALFAVLTLAASMIWTSDSDWSTGTFTNVTNITGDLMLNNTIANGTQTFYSWFYNGWTYRKAIIINGSTSLQNNYQINLSINSSGMGSNFNWSSLGNDTRFTWLNTTSGQEQNISFWIESWYNASGSGNATLWVKMPNITASSVANTTLYLYYGNPSATYDNSIGRNNTFDFSNQSSLTVGGADGPTYITLTNSTQTDVTNMPRNPEAYAYYMLPINYSDFKFTFEWYGTVGAGADYGIVGMADSLGTWAGATKVINGLTTSTNMCTGNFAGISHWTSGTSSCSETATTGNTLYYGTFTRSGTSVVFSLYTDSARKTSVSGYPLSYTDAVPTNFSYVVIFVNYGASSGNPATARVMNVILYKYASPEPNVLSVGTEQTASSRGTYLSNTTTTASPIGSITPIINKTEYNYNGAINLTNITVDISANGGSSWCENAANGTSYTNCGGIGSGTQFKYMVNFSTNDTSRTASLSDITLDYTIINNVNPQWYANATSKASPQTYNTGTAYGWQINSSDNNMNNTWFQLGRPSGTLTNYTALNNSASGKDVWYYNLTQAALGGAGTYNITWFLNDTENAQNKSDTANYVINKVATSTRLFLNGTEGNKNYNISQTANFTVSINIGGKMARLDTNLSGWNTASGTSPLYNYTALQSTGIFNITGYFSGDENYSASSVTYFANVSWVIANITLNLALHIGSAFADDSLQNGNNYDCMQDGSGWFGLTTENPAQAQSGNLSADYNINVSFTSNNKAFLALGKGSCTNFRRYVGDAQLKRFLFPLIAFSYAKTNLIQLILQFNGTHITNDAHWGKGTYLLSIANQGYNATSGKQNLGIKVVK